VRSQAAREPDSGAAFLKYHVLGPDAFEIRADRPAAAGAQLFEDYGDNPNSVYATYHGFVPAANPFDCVEVDLSPPAPAAGAGAEAAARRGAIARAVLGAGGAPPVECLRPGGGVPARAWSAVRVGRMSEEAVQAAACARLATGARGPKAVAACVGDAPVRAGAGAFGGGLCALLCVHAVCGACGVMWTDFSGMRRPRACLQDAGDADALAGLLRHRLAAYPTGAEGDEAALAASTGRLRCARGARCARARACT
jgi:hypothetical protein